MRAVPCTDLLRSARHALLAVLVIGTGSPVQAYAPQSMRFEHLTIDDGLSQSNVKAIVQDHSGLLWFGTESGLNRYDGYNFRRYHHDRSSAHSLQNDFIGDIKLDAAGQLWVATDGGGVAIWDPMTDRFQVLRHEAGDSRTIADDHVRVVLPDPRGWVWIGTRHHGLSRLDRDTREMVHYRHQPDNSSSLSHDDVYDLRLGPDGAIWIATHAGVNRLHPATGSVQRFEHHADNPQGLSHPVAHSLLFDSAGDLWVGTLGGGLNLLNVNTGTFRSFRHDPADRTSLSDDHVQTLFEDSAGRLWVGTSDGLNLMHRDTNSFSTYRHAPADPTSLSGDNIVSLFEDTSGVLWVGTKVAGVNKWNPRSWSFGHIESRQEIPGSLSSSHVSSFTETPDGRLWVGTFGGGLNVFDSSDGQTRYLRHDDHDSGSLSDDRVMALLSDRAGHVWVGTMGGGLNRIDADTGDITVYRHEPGNPGSLAADGIMSLFEDSLGRIWIGTFGGGVSRRDNQDGLFTNFPPAPDGLSVGRATAITEDRSGTIWIGTDGGGLNAFDPATGDWKTFMHDGHDPASLSSNTVYSLHVDDTNQLWVGTRNGFNRLLRDGTVVTGFKSLTRFDGLANDTIYGIRPDLYGHLWLSTNYGLIRFNPADGGTRTFHYGHGLQGEEFNFGAHYANPRGELFFGGSNGFNRFDPIDLAFNSTPPRVVLTSFAKLNAPVWANRPFDRLEQIDLGYNDDVVTFEVAALDFVAPKQNRYAYLLEGFDTDWVDAGDQRRFTYTNLDAGAYVLRVKAANSDGIWSSDELRLPFTVASPPWRSWWAYLLYALAIGALVYSYIRAQRLRFEREAEYARRLQAEVNERTTELAERNTDLRVANARLHEASHTDALTGLRNRRYLFDEISADIERRQRDKPGIAQGRRRSSEVNNDIIFIVVDLDRFKPVNDSLGHLAGDQMLLQVRDVLLKACRASDIVIRWGGDEFLVVARGATRDDATALVERIRSCIDAHVFSFRDGATTRSTCSIGFAAYPFVTAAPELMSWQQVLNVADTAMYRAKALRNAWSGIYCSDWSGSAEELLAALKRDAEQLAESGVVSIVDSHRLLQRESA